MTSPVAFAAARERERKKKREYMREWSRTHPERVRRKNAQYREKNRETLAAKQRDYWWKNPELNREKCRLYRGKNLESAKARDRRYYKANRAALLKRASDWSKANPVAASERSVAWRKLHPEVGRAAAARHKARKHEAPGQGVTTAEMREVMLASLGLCAYCNGRKKLTADHIDPLARGGAHEPSNLVGACGRCNTSKNDKPLLVWLALRAAA